MRNKNVVCVYCGKRSENPLLTDQESVEGFKIRELFEFVAHEEVPADLKLQVCGLCASNLVSARSVIKKSIFIIERSKAVSNPTAIVDLTAEETPSTTRSCKPTIAQRIQSLGTASDLIFPRVQLGVPQQHTSRVESAEFKCKFCEFHVHSEQLFRNHLREIHGKKRPRIYFCAPCRKSYGILTSWRQHTQTVHGINAAAPHWTVTKAIEEAKAKAIEEAKAKAREEAKAKARQLAQAKEEAEAKERNKIKQEMKAKLKLLTKAKLKVMMLLEKATNSPPHKLEVNGSTSNAANISIGRINKYFCDDCDSKLTTIQQMQEHMKTTHGIGNPTCDTSKDTKQTLQPHKDLDNKGAGAEESSKRKRQQEKQKVEAGEEDESSLDEPKSNDYIVLDVQPPKKAPQESDSDSFDGNSIAAESLLRSGQHIGELTCPDCQTSCSSQRDYVNHFRSCKSLYPCGVANCRARFYNTKLLILHLNRDH